MRKLTPINSKALRMDDERRALFLEELAKHGIVLAAARSASISKDWRGACASFYDERERNPEFAKLWDEALKVAATKIEQEIYRRGVEGFEETRTDGKGDVSITQRYSDACLLSLARYRIAGFGKQEIESRVDAKVHASVDLAGLSNLSRESREDLRRIIERESKK